MTKERIAQIIYEELAKPGSANAWVTRAAEKIMDEVRDESL